MGSIQTFGVPHFDGARLPGVFQAGRNFSMNARFFWRPNFVFFLLFRKSKKKIIPKKEKAVARDANLTEDNDDDA